MLTKYSLVYFDLLFGVSTFFSKKSPKTTKMSYSRNKSITSKNILWNQRNINVTYNCCRDRSSPLYMFLKVGILKNFANFTKNHKWVSFWQNGRAFFKEHFPWLLLLGSDWIHDFFSFFVLHCSFVKRNLHVWFFCFEKPLEASLTLLQSNCSCSSYFQCTFLEISVLWWYF